MRLYVVDEAGSDDDPNQGGWVQILPWLILGMFYFLTAGSDPTPETTWSTFYREMLSAGEVKNSTLMSITLFIILIFVFCDP